MVTIHDVSGPHPHYFFFSLFNSSQFGFVFSIFACAVIVYYLVFSRISIPSSPIPTFLPLTLLFWQILRILAGDCTPSFRNILPHANHALRITFLCPACGICSTSIHIHHPTSHHYNFYSLWSLTSISRLVPFVARIVVFVSCNPLVLTFRIRYLFHFYPHFVSWSLWIPWLVHTTIQLEFLYLG